MMLSRLFLIPAGRTTTYPRPISARLSSVPERIAPADAVSPTAPDRQSKEFRYDDKDHCDRSATSPLRFGLHPLHLISIRGVKECQYTRQEGILASVSARCLSHVAET